jgi:hypothetical protein
LFSKLLAGGLSAGVMLVWWPLVFEQDGPTSWVLRGLLWTLCFEILLLCFAPVEKALLQSAAAQRARQRLGTLTAPARQAAERRRLAALGTTAAFALSIPVGLVVTGADHLKAPAAPKTVNITKVTKVVRPVKVQRQVIVKNREVPVTVYRAVAAPSAAVVTPSQMPIKRVASPAPSKAPSATQTEVTPTVKTPVQSKPTVIKEKPVVTPGVAPVTSPSPTEQPAPDAAS